MHSKHFREIMIPAPPNGKVAMVTGGSSGIGLAIAHELALRGYSLLVVSNQREELEVCRGEFEILYGRKCYVLYLDLADETSALELFNFCEEQRMIVEVVVNNAGFMIFAEVVETPIEKVSAMSHVHMLTPTKICRLFGKEMKVRKSGYILNTSSISSVMPYPGISLYGPTKTYIRYFTGALRSEMQEYGVRVTCLIPGATATPLHDAEKVNIPLAKRLHVMHSVEYVASRAVRALFRNKAECVPGLLNKIVMVVVPLVPSWLIEMINHRTSWLKKD
jgi:short-subunit dehydrogenase